MYIKKNNNNAGFTLVEVLITLALTVLLLSGIVELLTTSLSASRVFDAKVEAQQTARVVVGHMVRDLQFSKKITLNSPTKLELETDIDGKPQPKVTYFLDTDKVIKCDRNNGSGGQPLTSASTIGVTMDLKFEPVPVKDVFPIETDTVRITLTATANEGADDEISYPMHTVVTRLK